jgi:hypothetical protein
MVPTANIEHSDRKIGGTAEEINLKEDGNED